MVAPFRCGFVPLPPLSLDEARCRVPAADDWSLRPFVPDAGWSQWMLNRQNGPTIVVHEVALHIGVGNGTRSGSSEAGTPQGRYAKLAEAGSVEARLNLKLRS